MSPPRPISDKHRRQLVEARAAVRKRLAMRLQMPIPDLGPKPKRARRRPPVTRRLDQPELFEPPPDEDINQDR